MDCWWTELELKLSLTIPDQHKANLEGLTGCSPILLRPLLSASRIVPVPESTDSDEHHAEMIEHLLTTLEESGEVRKVREDILAFVADKHAKLASEPNKWTS
jgi:hypothetical protein